MKKLLLLSSITFALSCSSSFADALMFTVNATPYDNQMERIRPVLNSGGGSGASHVSMMTVNAWMTNLRTIPYGFTRAWKMPNETEFGGAADCKAKAVALYAKMTAHGAKNVRLVIGRRTASSRQTHAWLSWQTTDGNFVLDPTFNYAATPATQVGHGNYEPLYAFEGSKKFRATSGLVAQN